MQAAGYAFDVTGHPRARPGRHRARRDPGRHDRRPRPARHHGHARPELARILIDRAAAVGVKLRFGTTSPSSPRTPPASTSPSPTARPAATTSWSAPTASARGPARARHRPGDQADRHGHLAGLRRRGRPASPAPTCTTAAPSLHRRLLPHRRGLALRVHRRGRPGPLRADAASSGSHDAASCRRPTTARGTTSARRSPTPPGSTTPGSRPTCWTRRGTAAGSCSSATPRTPARPPSPRAAPWRSRTPPSSPSCCWPRDDLDQRAVGRLPRPPLRARQDRRRRLQPARPVACSTHVEGDVPGLMRRIAVLVSQPA